MSADITNSDIHVGSDVESLAQVELVPQDVDINNLRRFASQLSQLQRFVSAKLEVGTSQAMHDAEARLQETVKSMKSQMDPAQRSSFNKRLDSAFSSKAAEGGKVKGRSATDALKSLSQQADQAVFAAEGTNGVNMAKDVADLIQSLERSAKQVIKSAEKLAQRVGKNQEPQAVTLEKEVQDEANSINNEVDEEQTSSTSQELETESAETASVDDQAQTLERDITDPATYEPTDDLTDEQEADSVDGELEADKSEALEGDGVDGEEPGVDAETDPFDPKHQATSVDSDLTSVKESSTPSFGELVGEGAEKADGLKEGAATAAKSGESVAKAGNTAAKAGNTAASSAATAGSAASSGATAAAESAKDMGKAGQKGAQAALDSFDRAEGPDGVEMTKQGFNLAIATATLIGTVGLACTLPVLAPLFAALGGASKKANEKGFDATNSLVQLQGDRGGTDPDNEKDQSDPLKLAA